MAPRLAILRNPDLRPLAQELPDGWPPSPSSDVPARLTLVPGAAPRPPLEPRSEALLQTLLATVAGRLGRAALDALRAQAADTLGWVQEHHREEFGSFDWFARACLREALPRFEEEVGRSVFVRRRSKTVPSAEQLRLHGLYALQVEREDQDRRDAAVEAQRRYETLRAERTPETRRQARACGQVIWGYLQHWHRELTQRLRQGSRFLRTPGVSDDEVCHEALMALHDSLARPETTASYAKPGVALSLKIALAARDRLRQRGKVFVVGLEDHDGELSRQNPTPSPEQLLLRDAAERRLGEVLEDAQKGLSRIQRDWWMAMEEDVEESDWEERLNRAAIANRLGRTRYAASRMAKKLRAAVLDAGVREALEALAECNICG
jgi:hypothetical protein